MRTKMMFLGFTFTIGFLIWMKVRGESPSPEAPTPSEERMELKVETEKAPAVEKAASVAKPVESEAPAPISQGIVLAEPSDEDAKPEEEAKGPYVNPDLIDHMTSQARRLPKDHPLRQKAESWLAHMRVINKLPPDKVEEYVAANKLQETETPNVDGK